MPDVSNGENFDTRLFVRGQYIVEVQHNYSLLGAPGVLRVTGFEEQFYAGSYAATFGIFIAAWLISYVFYRANRYDEIEVEA